MGAVVGDEAGERGGNGLGEVGVFRVVGADVAVHLLCGERNVEIVGNESGFFIGEMKIGFAEMGEEKAELHAQETECCVPPACNIIHRITHLLRVLQQLL